MSISYLLSVFEQELRAHLSLWLEAEYKQNINKEPRLPGEHLKKLRAMAVPTYL